MADKKVQFLNQLHEAAKKQEEAGRPFSADEIRAMFAGMDLSEEQEKLVQRFLNRSEEEKAADDPDAEKRKKVYDRFEEEAKRAAAVTPGEYEVLVRDLPTDNRVTLEKIYTYKMPSVVAAAREYDHPQIRPEDMIQQGYIRLWEELVNVNERIEAEDLDAILDAAVTREIQELVIAAEGEKERENSTVSKASMVYEAQKLLAEENGVVPSMRELSTFTNLPVEEIRDILAMIKKVENTDKKDQPVV